MIRPSGAARARSISGVRSESGSGVRPLGAWIGLARAGLEPWNGRGAGRDGPPLGAASIASATYHQLPWVSAALLQPPWPCVPHVRVLTPVVPSFVIVNVLVDFDVAVTA